jgi:hypothetical protein
MSQSEIALAFDDALAAGDASRAIAILNSGLDPNYQGPGASYTPLTLAAGSGALSVVDTAIHRGGSVNLASGSTRSTALHIAANLGWADVVARLLTEGANANLRDVARNTPLHNAAAMGFPIVTDQLLKAGANARLTNAHGATPLQVAAGASWQARAMDREMHEGLEGPLFQRPPTRDHIAVVDLLLERGVSKRDLSKARFFANQYTDTEMQRRLNAASAEGCFVATTVYGSYEAPEVLVLRRFRDETLVRSRSGRAFISCYYAISPSLARQIKAQGAASRISKRLLDLLVYTVDR